MPSVRQVQLSLFSLLALLGTSAQAEYNFAGGVWFNYNYSFDDGSDEPNNGNFGDEAFIIYADGAADPGKGIWSYSAEWRMGPGSFTDPEHNSTGNQMSMKRAWVGFDLIKNNILKIGKSQVPFGWKTYNFWPGDMLIGGYGDQMDVGLKWHGQTEKILYDFAYYHQDDFGDTSSDTMDDNNHWGSHSGGKTRYRKVQTWVGNFAVNVNEDHQVGVSLQTGQLQDIYDASGNDVGNHPVSGNHAAGVVYYKGHFGETFVNAQVIQTQRRLPDHYADSEGLEKDIENTRYAFEIGRSTGNWTYYLDASWADPQTKGNPAGLVSAYAPGIKYDYGPGWLYAEYLTQDGYIGMDGNVGEGDFSALYLTVDFYF